MKYMPDRTEQTTQRSFFRMPGSDRAWVVALYLIGTFVILEILLLLFINYRRYGRIVLRPVSEAPHAASVAVDEQAESTGSGEVVVSDKALADDLPFHILLLGIDRRHASDTSFRSDVNLLVSLSADRSKAVFTSIPRDLWIDGSRINAFITTDGPDAMKEKVQKVTGVLPDRYVQIDFDAYAEGIDALGGVTVDVLQGFTDSNYPDDRNGSPELIRVTFETGEQFMDGETALIFARSRKGNNGEGSDFKRMARQQQVLKALPPAFFSPRSIFNPFNLQQFYATTTTRMRTDMSLEDIDLAYELLKTYEDVQVEQLVLDPTYLYSPPPADYGGAYVLRPQGETFAPIHQLLQEKLQ